MYVSRIRVSRLWFVPHRRLLAPGKAGWIKRKAFMSRVPQIAFGIRLTVDAMFGWACLKLSRQSVVSQALQRFRITRLTASFERLILASPSSRLASSWRDRFAHEAPAFPHSVRVLSCGEAYASNTHFKEVNDHEHQR